MATAISSPVEMLAYAAVLRKAAEKAAAAETAQKIKDTASSLEKTAMARVSPAGPNLGKLLDTFA